MKKAFIAGVALFLGVQVVGFAQNTIGDEVTAVQKIWGLEKKSMIDKYMRFTEAEAAAFWPVYDEYMSKKEPMGKKWIMLLVEYADSYTTMNDEKAQELTVETMKNQTSIDKLKLTYYKKMTKAIGARRASQFMQLETHIETAIRYEVQSSIPFIGEIEFSAPGM